MDRTYIGQHPNGRPYLHRVPDPEPRRDPLADLIIAADDPDVPWQSPPPWLVVTFVMGALAVGFAAGALWDWLS